MCLSLEQIKDLKISYNIPLKDYTTFKIGGPAHTFLIPKTIPALQQSLQIIQKQKSPFFILGKGSNLIVSDKGFQGIVIYTGELKQVKFNSPEIIAEAGISLASLAQKAMKADLSGLEFLSGIPGTLGGALYMNAGAYGSELKDIISSAKLLDSSCQELILNKTELKLGYRNSILQEKPLIVTEIKLHLKESKKETIQAKMKELNTKRKTKQPLTYPSAGSTFKRPSGYYAGQLIENAGLKGLTVGGAQISKKHAGFIINNAQATAQDILELIKLVQKKVYEKNGVKLEVEPQFIGDFS